MSTISDLQRIRRRYMDALEAREAGALARMIESYATIVNGLQVQAETAWLDIERSRAAGEDISRSRLFQLERIQALLKQAEQEFTAWAQAAQTETINLQRSAAQIAGQAVGAELAYLTTPPSGGQALPGESANVAGAFDVLPSAAVLELLGALEPDSPVAQLFSALPADISADIRKALVIGLAVGENPRAVGRRMKRASGGGLANGVRIARTEMMRAYRTAHHENYKRNDDVVKGWVWLSARNSRTCAACLARHGTFHTNDETMDSHPNCRCTPVPVTRTWAEMGLGGRGYRETSLGAPGNQVQSGEDWFRAQPMATWQRVLGKTAAEAYAAGRVKLDDFVGVQRSRVWGDSVYQRSLADALKAAQKRERTSTVSPVANATPARRRRRRATSVAGAGPRFTGGISQASLDEAFEAAYGQGQTARAVLSPIFEHELGEGVRTELRYTEVYGRNTVRAETYFMRDGQRIGYAARRINFADKSVDHAFFTMERAWQSSGIGSRFYQLTEQGYIRLGLREITIHANIDVGGYAWARMGFDFANNGVREDLRRRAFALWVQRYRDPDTAPFPLDEAPRSWDIATLAGPDGYRIGKVVMLGSDWHGVKDLTDGSEHRRIADAYYAAKRLERERERE